MKLGVIAILLCASLADVAAADTCAPAGGVLLTVKREVIDKRDPDASPYTFVIYKSGAWTLESPGPMRVSGCGSVLGSGKHVASRISLALAAAPWKVTRAKSPPCRDKGSMAKTYVAGGKTVFTEVTCGLDTLDAKSAASLEKIKEQVETITNERSVRI